VTPGPKKVRRLGGEPAKGVEKVKADVEKIGRYLEHEACRSGYVIAFEECDYGFGRDFAAKAEAESGCQVRFVRVMNGERASPS